MTVTPSEADLLAAAVVRVARLIASGQSWLALDALIECIQQIPAVATGVDVGQRRAALYGTDADGARP